MADITNLTTDELIQELARRVINGELAVSNVAKKISDIVLDSRNINISDYHKIMQKKIKKFGYIGKYDLKGTIGVFETIHDKNFNSISEFIEEVNKKNGVTTVSLKYSLFDNNMRQYSALRECLKIYLYKIKNILDVNKYWSMLSKEEKLKCYIELEKYIYNL